MKKKQLRVSVADKVAIFQRRDGDIVCGNSDYEVVFTFDGEWAEYQTKIARFIWNGVHTDVEINGDNTCPVPMLRNTAELTIGVYAEGIATTTPARIDCVRSILCGDEPQTEADENYTSEAKAAAISANESATAAKASADASAASASSAQESANIALSVAADSVNMDARISRNSKRITNLEKGLVPDPFETDCTTAYIKDVPEGALPYAEVNQLGGMSYKTKNLLKPYAAAESGWNGFTIKRSGDGATTISGTATKDFNLLVDICFDGVNYPVFMEANQKYTLTVLKDGEKVDIGEKIVYADGAQETYWGWQGDITRPRYLTKLYVQTDVKTGETPAVNGTYKAILTKGTEVVPYEPYFDGVRDSKVTEVTSVGVNLFDNSGVSKTQTGIKFDSYGAYVRLNGTKTAGENVVSVKSTNVLLPKGTYTVSIQIIEGGIDSSNSTNYDGIMFGINKSTYGQRTSTARAVGDIGTRTFTLTEDTLVTSFDITPSYGGEGTVYTNVLLACQLERNDTRSDFVPYKENSLTIPDAVQSLDGYGDGMNESVYNYIDWEKKQFVKRVEKLTLNGSNTAWTSLGSTGLYNTTLMNNAKKHNNSAVYALCSDIPYTTNASYLNSYYIARVNNDRGLQFNNVLSIYGLSENTSAAFNAYLAEHPMTFVYELAEPIVTDISNLITDDNLIGVEPYGTLTFENEYGFGVPSEVTYQIKGGAA